MDHSLAEWVSEKQVRRAEDVDLMSVVRWATEAGERVETAQNIYEVSGMSSADIVLETTYEEVSSPWHRVETDSLAFISSKLSPLLLLMVSICTSFVLLFGIFGYQGTNVGVGSAILSFIGYSDGFDVFTLTPILAFSGSIAVGTGSVALLTYWQRYQYGEYEPYWTVRQSVTVIEPIVAEFDHDGGDISVDSPRLSASSNRWVVYSQRFGLELHRDMDGRVSVPGSIPDSVDVFKQEPAFDSVDVVCEWGE